MVKEVPDMFTSKSRDKIPTATIKRPTRKKPKDKPKRPLSAYNFFFKEERARILKVVLAEDPKDVDNEPGSDGYLNEDMLTKLRKEGGKVSFEEMGKLIGQRWKSLDPKLLTKYTKLAAEDTERYKKEMQSYNSRQEAKMRNDVLKPPVWAAGVKPEAFGAIKAPGDMNRYDHAAGAGMNAQFGNPQMAAYSPYGVDLGTASAYAMGQPMGVGGMYGGYAAYGMGAMSDPSGGAMGGNGAAAANAMGMPNQLNRGNPPGAPAPGGAAGMYSHMMMGGGVGQLQAQMMGYG